MVMVTPFFIATLLLLSGRLGHSQQYKQGPQCMTPLEISISVRKRVWMQNNKEPTLLNQNFKR
jgi:hypothetical protein